MTKPSALDDKGESITAGWFSLAGLLDDPRPVFPDDVMERLAALLGPV